MDATKDKSDTRLHPILKVRLARARPFFGPGPAELLRRISLNGSVRTACHEMGISYSKGWKMIALMEAETGTAVVLRRQGGRHGGEAGLSPAGRDLLDKYRRFEERCQDLARLAFCEIFDPDG